MAKRTKMIVINKSSSTEAVWQYDSHLMVENISFG
jgi:hypothetical protein